MKIKKSDYKILKEFHNSFFKVRFFIEGVKPDIDRFIIDNKLSHDKRRWRTLFALYTFNFWCLGYTLRAPSMEHVLKKFEDYN